MQNKDARVADIITIMDELAPPRLAEQWDNCGLQVGSRKWPVKKIWVALDPLFQVVEAAIQDSVDMVITHHPLMIQPLAKIDLDSDAGRVIGRAIEGRLAIFAAHTNLDSALEGINDLLAHKVGLQDLAPLLPVRSALIESDDDAQMPLAGLGRIGRLPSPATVGDLAKAIKTQLGIDQVKIAGDTRLAVDHVAVCSGSGASLVDAFLETDAQVYVSGDLKYHQARIVESAGRALIDVGHFASEHIFIDAMVKKLQGVAKAAGWPVTVQACQLEQDPFVQL